MGGDQIRVTFWRRGEYIDEVYTYDVFDLWMSDPLVVRIIDNDTGEVLFPLAK